MELRQFLDAQPLTYSEYQNIRAHLSHISSFALWPAKHTGNQAPALLVDTEADFNAQLAGKLHKNVVMLGYGYGNIKTTNKTIAQQIAMQPNDRLALYKSLINMNNQYGGGDAKKGIGPKFTYYNAVDSLVRGAYLSDLFKFSTAEKNHLIASGLPEKNGDDFKKTYTNKMPGYIPFNIDGLAYELEQIVGLDTSKPFVILLMGKTFFKDYKAAVEAKFPTAIVEIMYSYKASNHTNMANYNGNVIDKVITAIEAL